MYSLVIAGIFREKNMATIKFGNYSTNMRLVGNDVFGISPVVTSLTKIENFSPDETIVTSLSESFISTESYQDVYTTYFDEFGNYYDELTTTEYLYTDLWVNSTLLSGSTFLVFKLHDNDYTRIGISSSGVFSS